MVKLSSQSVLIPIQMLFHVIIITLGLWKIFNQMQPLTPQPVGQAHAVIYHPYIH